MNLNGFDAMMRCCVLGCWLVVDTQALIAPAPIRWMGLQAKQFFIAPKPLSSTAFIPSRNSDPSSKLAIWERSGTAPQEVPHFTADREGTISWGAGRCVEANAAQSGASIRIDRCTGTPTQLWSVMPWRREKKSQIQLKGTTKCIGVSDKEKDMDGALLELRECDERASESWMFEETVPHPAPPDLPQHRSPSSSLRHVLMCCASMILLGSFGVGASLWRCQRKARMAIVRQTSTLLHKDQGGICLVEPTVAHQSRTEGTASSRVVQTSMSGGTDDPRRDGKGNGNRFAANVDMASTFDAKGFNALPDQSESISQGGNRLSRAPLVGTLHKTRPPKRLWSVPELELEAPPEFGTPSVHESFQGCLAKYLKAANRDCTHCHQALRENKVSSALALLVTMLGTVLSSPMRAGATELTSTASVVDFRKLAYESLLKGLRAGTAGLGASMIELFALQWLHTAKLYQHRYGGTLKSSVQALMKEGGFLRLYRGMSFSIVLLPLSRFGVAAANIGTLALFDGLPAGALVPMPIRSALATVFGVSWKVLVCLPIETAKVTVQVSGGKALKQLMRSVREKGPGVLYRGWLIAAVGGVLSTFPFLITYNFVNSALPVVLADKVVLRVFRSALVGIAAQCASSTFSNAFGVIKTNQQTRGVTATEAFSLIVEADGIKGLFGRGLKTDLFDSALRGSLFNVLWVYLQREKDH